MRIMSMRLLIVLVLATAADVSAATGTITRLSSGAADDQQNQPAISGTNVVWTEAETPAGSNTNFDIYYFDINNPASGLNLTNTPAEQEFLEDIDGTNVVWTRTTAGVPGDIVVYDLATNTNTTVAASSTSVYFQQPAIRGSWITFLRVGAQVDVFLYNLMTGAVGLITNDAAPQARPRVSPNLVVYEDYNSGNADIIGYTVPSGPAFTIASGSNDQITPDVDGNTVVYVEYVNGTTQIFAYDVAARTTRQLTSSTSTKVLPRISGNRVVWSDDRAGNLDLYMADIAAGTEEPLVTGSGDQFLSDIDGNRVVYTDNSAGFEQVYLFTFSSDPPPPPPKLPPGCDPKKTDLVGSMVSMQRNDLRPIYIHGDFKADPNKTYYVCVENGRPDGSQRTAQFSFEANHRLVLNPSDFRPLNNPPHWVAAEIPTDKQCKRRHASMAGMAHGNCQCDPDDVAWTAALFARMPPESVNVSIRVSK
jgi:TolB protein